MPLRVSLSWTHNLVGLAQQWAVPPHDPQRVLRLRRPNAMEAEALFRSDWQDAELPATAEGDLAVHVCFDHVGRRTPDLRLVRVARGWAALACLDRARLMRGTAERSIREIHLELERQMGEILARAGRLRRTVPGN